MDVLIMLLAALVAITVGGCYLLKWVSEYPAEVFWIALGIAFFLFLEISHG